MSKNDKRTYLKGLLESLYQKTPASPIVDAVRCTLNTVEPYGGWNLGVINPVVGSTHWVRTSLDYGALQKLEIIEVDEHFRWMDHLSHSEVYAMTTGAQKEHEKGTKHPPGAYVIHQHLNYFISLDGLRQLNDAITRDGKWVTGRKLIPS